MGQHSDTGVAFKVELKYVSVKGLKREGKWAGEAWGMLVAGLLQSA